MKKNSSLPSTTNGKAICNGMRIKKEDLFFQRLENNLTVSHNGIVVARAEERLEDFVVSMVDEEGVVQKAVLAYNEDEIVEHVLDWLRKPVYKIVHISDNHSRFPHLRDCDVVIHSGDFLPNASRGRLDIEIPFQTEWIRKNEKILKFWLQGKKFIFCSGNHDFIDPIPLLIEMGIDAVNITNAHHEHLGVRYYGFPFIPILDREWNYERDVQEMGREIRRLKDELAKGVDVLVCHAPPHGILDSNFYVPIGRNREELVDYGDRCGNSLLTNLLSYDLPNMPFHDRPQYLLCGHIHEHNGVVETLGLTISNAATTAHVIEINL